MRKCADVQIVMPLQICTSNLYANAQIIAKNIKTICTFAHLKSAHRLTYYRAVVHSIAGGNEIQLAVAVFGHQDHAL